MLFIYNSKKYQDIKGYEKIINQLLEFFIHVVSFL